MKCPVVHFWVFMGLAWLWEACLLLLRAVFLLSLRISMVCLVLELGSWVELVFFYDPTHVGNLMSGFSDK